MRLHLLVQVNRTTFLLLLSFWHRLYQAAQKVIILLQTNVECHRISAYASFYLSGTVCTKQPNKFSFFNKQTKSVYGCPLFKLFSQIIYSNAVHLSSSSFCSCSPNTFSTSSSYKSLLIIAIPCFSSPRSSTLSPGLKLKISLASFGITICPFDPIFAVQACLSSGLVIISPPKSMFCMIC